LSLEDTQKKLDKALKRNLAEPSKTNPTPVKPQGAELSVDESVSDAGETIEA